MSFFIFFSSQCTVYVKLFGLSLAIVLWTGGYCLHVWYPILSNNEHASNSPSNKCYKEPVETWEKKPWEMDKYRKVWLTFYALQSEPVAHRCQRLNKNFPLLDIVFLSLFSSQCKVYVKFFGLSLAKGFVSGAYLPVWYQYYGIKNMGAIVQVISATRSQLRLEKKALGNGQRPSLEK